MFIKQITIEGVEGDVDITRTEGGAIVSANDVEVLVARTASREERFEVAYNAAKIICGETKRGEPNATNSMIHDVLQEIERVAGC
jgi:hypothetical protein